uniref:Prenyltransferase alpha-alpha toroid domain-containing protein n=1 Tax=Hucho hucho TaxID=62062 RepID=A0A4W5PVI6_9TELE
MRFEGGFQGRCNKLVDGCYSFWQAGLLPLLHRALFKEGGYPPLLVDKPGRYVTQTHTFFFFYTSDCINKTCHILCKKKKNNLSVTRSSLSQIQRFLPHLLLSEWSVCSAALWQHRPTPRADRQPGGEQTGETTGLQLLFAFKNIMGCICFSVTVRIKKIKEFQSSLLISEAEGFRLLVHGHCVSLGCILLQCLHFCWWYSPL